MYIRILLFKDKNITNITNKRLSWVEIVDAVGNCENYDKVIITIKNKKNDNSKNSEVQRKSRKKPILRGDSKQ